ncbi:MAG: hypothetical protein ABIA02_02550 [Candidatus Falkowbacteria bacterium]
MIFSAIIAVILNVCGLKTLNAVLGCILPAVAIFISSRPNVIAGLIGTGIATNIKTPIAGSTDSLEIWAKLVGYALLYSSIFFLFMGTFTISRNFGSIPLILLALILIFLFSVVWGMEVVITRKLLHAYTIVVLIVATGSIISGATWTNVFGFDPYGSFRISTVDSMIYEAEILDQKNQESKDVKILHGIIEKKKKGVNLTEQEKKDLQRLREKRDSKNLPNRGLGVARKAGNAVSGLWGKIFKSSPDDSDDDQQNPDDTGQWWQDEIVIGKDEKITIGSVQEGDQLRSWSSGGFILLEEKAKPDKYQPKIDMTTTFCNITGYHKIELSGNHKNNTIIKYKITRGGKKLSI